MSFCKLFLVFGVSTALFLTTCYSQTFDPDVDDKEYLDAIQKNLRREVVRTHAVLVNQTKVLQQVTSLFIESKIKENLFKAVRARVEMELDMMAENNVSFRRARQDDNEEDDDGGSSTPRPRPPGLLPQLANVVSTLFGSDVNVTSYLKEATSFLPPDISYRIVSAASLIDPQRFTSTTTRAPVIINGQVIPDGALVNTSAYINYQTGITPPLTHQQSINVGGIAQANVHLTPGADRVIQGVAQSGSFQTPSGDRVVQGTAQTGGVSSVQPAVVETSGATVAPLRVPQQGSSQTQAFVANDVQPSINHIAPAIAAVPSRTKLVQHVSPTVLAVQSGQVIPPGAIIIQPEYNQQAIPSIQILPQTAALQSEYNSEEDDSSREVETTNRFVQNEEDSGESADDLTIAHDESRTDPPRGSLIGGYPALNYAFKFFNRLTSKSEVPTTTEYMNVTRKSLDSIEEEEARATSPATTTFQTIVQGGVYLYEGAREAYTLLQHLNKFLDRVGDRLDSAGLGVAPVPVPGAGNTSEE